MTERELVAGPYEIFYVRPDNTVGSINADVDHLEWDEHVTLVKHNTRTRAAIATEHFLGIRQGQS